MLAEEVNRRLTQIGPGTPAGAMFRRYWLPVALCAEANAIPRPLRILGEDLVLFRDEHGRPGLIGPQCPHRLTSFEYARVECGGIRCLYHGWLFDVDGNCLEMPGEPPESSFKDKVRHLAYPCRELGGLIFAFMGPGAPPLLPNYEILTREDCTRHTSRDWMIHPCNYLQLIENDMDPIHAFVLHGDRRIAQNSLFPNMPKWIRFEDWALGVRSLRYADGPRPNTAYKRIVNTILPTVLAFGGGRNPDLPDAPEFGGSVRWRIPIDDNHTMFFRVYMTPHVNGRPADQSPPRDMGGTTVDEDVIARSHAGEMWRPTRDESGAVVLDKTWKQDYVAIVSQGTVIDRTREHLGYSDRGVILMRRSLLAAIKAVEEGRDPPGVVRDPARNELIQLPKTNEIILGRSADEIIATLGPP